MKSTKSDKKKGNDKCVKVQLSNNSIPKIAYQIKKL